MSKCKPPPEFVYNPPTSQIPILYHDEDIIILDKPAGLLTVPGRKQEHQDSLALRIQKTYPNAQIVHRLDMETSGLLIMALNKESHRNLGAQFETRKVEKTYFACVWGKISEDLGCVELPLICDWPNRPLQMVDFEKGRAAKTTWRVLERNHQNTRVALTPVTGRTHQLRVHMAEIGHPILGDDFYAHKKAFEASPRLLLHAECLSFLHPVTSKRITIKSECPF
ncbi:MAG: RluA family pseudouridine synthase [Alphaproteobacteria bacterium]|nr:RluA family pseudouridine synthase [Alphaproteobacteria bacterium]